MDGILVVNKPQDMTSHDVVVWVRRRFHLRKVGHAGTLDPIATGVLVLLVGRTTREAFRFLQDDKAYRATMVLGAETDTQDRTGKVIERRDVSPASRTEIAALFSEFTGEIEQIPPMTSALWHKGKRLYVLAREGKTVDRKARKVRIYELELEEYDLPYLTFRATCSKGTYIRTLCADIGKRLGCGAHMTELCRLRSGDFELSEAQTLESLERISPEELEDMLIKMD